MNTVQVTRWLPPAASCKERMFVCAKCGGYQLRCCPERDAHEVVLRSAWAVECVAEWAVLELLRLRDKGDSAWVQDWAGESEGKAGDVAIFREVEA